MLLIRDTVDRIDIERDLRKVVCADFAIVEIEHLTLAQLRGLKAFVNSKITEIQAYMTDNGIENREVSDNG